MVEIAALSYHDRIHSLDGALTLERAGSRAWYLLGFASRILTVTTAANGPLVVRIAALPPSSRSLLPGQEARLETHSLTVGPVRIALPREGAWCPERRTGPPLIPSMLRQDLAALQEQTVWRRNWNLPDFATTRSTLLMALVCDDERSMASVVPRLLGGGSGLTPAGDDVLCGVLAGLRIFAQRSDAGHHWLSHRASRLDSVIRSQNTGSTTHLSRTFLSCAAGGVAVEPLLDVLWSLGTSRPVVGIGVLQNIGGTSGCAMLAGGLLAAEVALEGKAVCDPALGRPSQCVS